MVATEENDFQNGRQKPFWKNLYGNIFCTSWPISMIKMSSWGVFRVLNRLERFLIWSEVRIMRNSKWPPFLLQQIIFLFISSFIIDTGSPCARIGHHAPQSLSVLIRGFLEMFLAMLRGMTSGRDMGFGHFFKWPPWKSDLGNIPTSNWHRITILVSTPMFSGSKNRMKSIIKILVHSYMANSEKTKMATGENHFMTKSECLYWKFCFDMLKCYSNEDRPVWLSWITLYLSWSCILCSYRPEIRNIDILPCSLTNISRLTRNHNSSAYTYVFLGQRIAWNHSKHTGAIQ